MAKAVARCTGRWANATTVLARRSVLPVRCGFSHKYDAVPTSRPPQNIFLPQPTPEGIRAFRELYQQCFGVDLSSADALELATRTLHLVYLGTHPPATKSKVVPKEELKKGELEN